MKKAFSLLLPIKLLFAKYPSLSKLFSAAFLFLMMTGNAAAQTCNVINSIPAKPPTSGPLDVVVKSNRPGFYSVGGTKIYDTYDINGNGTPTVIPPSNHFWINYDLTATGPLNRCGVWAKTNPVTVGFTECVDCPADEIYYIGFGADNSGSIKVDGTLILQDVGFEYWSIYRVALSKGTHLVELAVTNFGSQGSIGYEIYNNTEQQIINATGYGGLNVISSSTTKAGANVEKGNPATSYSCPINFAQDYCSSSIPVCSQFVPINLVINNPAPACSTGSVDITAAAITAGSPSSLTYSYWQNVEVTVPLTDPGHIIKTGTYYVMGSSNYCSVVKPVQVIVTAANTLLTKTICLGDSYMGHTKSGIYIDTLQAADGCDSLVTTNLTVNPSLSLGANRILCHGDTIILNPGNFNSYLWQDGTTKPYYIVQQGGTYSVTVTSNVGCMASDTVMITEEQDCVITKIPNAFSPNNDGINDTWKIDDLNSYPLCTVLVYTRAGQVVFKSTGYAQPWDGKYNGKALPAGTYYYIINLKTDAPPISGYVTLIR